MGKNYIDMFSKMEIIMPKKIIGLIICLFSMLMQPVSVYADGELRIYNDIHFKIFTSWFGHSRIKYKITQQGRYTVIPRKQSVYHRSIKSGTEIYIYFVSQANHEHPIKFIMPSRGNLTIKCYNNPSTYGDHCEQK